MQLNSQNPSGSDTLSASDERPAETSPVNNSAITNVASNGGTCDQRADIAVGADVVQRLAEAPATAAPRPAPFCLDKQKALPFDSFPHKPVNGNRNLPTTIANVSHVLTDCGIKVGYDVISKRLTFAIPGLELSADSGDTAVTEIISLLQMNGLMVGPAREFIAAIGDRNRFNPAADWIKSRLWDGIDRLPEILATVKVAESYPTQLRDALMRRWLLSVVAAALVPDGFRSRGVLTFQGPQGIGKTSWLMSLVPESLRAKLVKIDHHLDASNKDSILGAISHLIVEIGELDSSFKKDVARLKGFLTATHDKVRRPYGRDESEYSRRTVFAATVNETNFLVDMTGNTRWWTIEAVSLNFQHGIDMQQLFAQLAVALEAGEQWWLTSEEEQLLDQQNATYLAVSVVRDRLSQYLDFVGQAKKAPEMKHVTATQILERIGFKSPNTAQVREAMPIFKAQFGPRKKISGKEGWKLPIRDDFVNVEQGRD
ncbi:VapE domain-containing protein [Roseateles sp. LKC17W]|uniref:VapE domain-containing protein n=1 Tax=Pelomonas margarita TaxID=3299031 RepID=A0ABW7FH12_9BURK